MFQIFSTKALTTDLATMANEINLAVEDILVQRTPAVPVRHNGRTVKVAVFGSQVPVCEIYLDKEVRFRTKRREDERT